MPDPIRVMVVDDHPLFRSGIIHSFDDMPDIEIVCEAMDGQDWRPILHRRDPPDRDALRPSVQAKRPRRLVEVDARDRTDPDVQGGAESGSLSRRMHAAVRPQ